MAEHRDMDEVDHGERRLENVPANPSASFAAAIETTSRAVLGSHIADLPRVAVAALVEAELLHGAGLWLLDQAGATLRRHAWAGELETPAAEWRTVELRGSALGAIARAPQPTQVGASAIIAEALPELAAGMVTRATFVGFPLVRDDRPLGVLGLLSRRRLGESELALGTLLARAVAAEIDVARLRGDTTAPLQANLIGLLGHELRTPLTALRGNVQLAAIGVQKGDYRRVSDRLAIALHLVDTMTALLQNLQDMSRIERGIFALSIAPADLTVALRNAVRRAERTISTERHTIALHADEPLVVVHDARQMEQVFVNLIVNALAYSPDGGTVEVRAVRDDRGARVDIVDVGIGVPLEEQERIFEPYFRGSRAREASAKGLGLGLAVSRVVVDYHGGSIRVESGPAPGSTFTVRLPPAPPTDD
ncbi:MAG TPA: GAF domain-containing sensor histidine kinase [Thermomicrobiaceae bacterium]|nr:GAF domain-containing sensor histidine kinase [Thermomicrobiaceae bacterium]